ncbi:protease I [Evansella vedderi]|uniref:Protease I n=1 Tax=Evansella vedderi TaxID=38282 RepID=A0ABU0A1H5_9BACI|nr:type 1 glutamine amidotransferase domain-containing protein [Evansella vedderi]MDQ0257342.1 protease I [Evansella vedderi]
MAKVAFLLANGYEDSEMKNPYEAVLEAGHEATIIGLEKDVVCQGKQQTVSYTVELAASEANGADFDAVIIPGGSAPEALRVNEEVVRFVKELNDQNKVIGGICHGPQVMISADVLKGKTATSFVGVRDDVINAGANFVDEEVVVSENIITSRTPVDEPAFIREILAKLQ